MDILEAFETLRRHGHVIDQFGFDENWLGRKPGYFAYLKSTNRDPSVETLMRFQLKLREHEKRNARWGVDTGELAELADLAMREIQTRCS